MLTVTCEDVCWSIRNVKFDIIKFSYKNNKYFLYTMRLLYIFDVCNVIPFKA